MILFRRYACLSRTRFLIRPEQVLRNVVLVLFVLASSVVRGQPYLLSADAPKDKPLPVTQQQQDKLNVAIAPLVAQAKATYPDARRRFLAGLPNGATFFVTVKIRDASGLSEQAFIAVQTIDAGIITGIIASEMSLVTRYKAGDAYRVAESEIIDWLIAKPDGTEEGNVVGKFMDSYRPEL